MKPGSAGYDAEVTRMAEMGFAHYTDVFESAEDLSVGWTGYEWIARCHHVHDDEREEGTTGDTPTGALANLVADLDYFDNFAKKVAATAEALHVLRGKFGGAS